MTIEELQAEKVRLEALLEQRKRELAGAAGALEVVNSYIAKELAPKPQVESPCEQPSA